MHQNFGIWWDADLLRETLDGTVISDINPTAYTRSNVLQAWEYGAAANNGTKNTPCLSGDFLGDWREEVICRNSANTALLVFVTTTPASNRLRTFLHDPQYRVALAWQNSAYNQPPHPSFFVGQDMAAPPMPDITTEAIALPRLPGDVVWTGGASQTWDVTEANFRVPGDPAPVSYLEGDDVRFDDSSPLGTVSLAATLNPAAVTADHSNPLVLSGTGSLAGAMTLEKSGGGNLTISTAQTFTGGTILNSGTLTLGNANALGTGTITLRGGTLATGTLAPPNSIIVENPSTISGGASNGVHGIKAISGTADLTLTATNVFDLEGSLTGFSGRFLLGGTGSFRLVGSNGSAQAGFDLGTRSLNARSGSSFQIGSLSGQPGSTLSGASGSGNNTAVTYTIGGNHLDSVFNGTISNGNNTCSIIKTGNGRLVLTGACTHTGSTQVQSGSLVVNGSLANTPVNVSTGATLAGIGTLSGNLTLAAGSKLGLAVTPSVTRGPSIGGNVTLQGAVTVTAEDLGGTLAAGTYPLLQHSGTISSNPQFVWSPPPGSPLTATFSVQANRIDIILTDPRPGLTIWSEQRYGASADSDLITPLADPDGNGVSNLMEYALGLSSAEASSSLVLPQPALNAGRLVLTFQRIADPLLTYTVEAGNTPDAMLPIWSSTGSSNTSGSITVQDTVVSQARRFMRLKVTHHSP
jgi:autotransporter-associated beta strand protein